MTLGTFGAILGFALEIEAQAAALYESEAGADSSELFQELARQTRKRQGRLERARREGVQEMILEPIQGLDRADYGLELPAGAGPLQQALALEERAVRFYRAAASNMPLRGVARLLQRLAEESAQRRAALEPHSEL
ncbi:MAG: hypothetical protein JXA37_10515 [Chloroflexia bacterium]|nr:hypothetical protein [Chloroflexia bacterium]